MGKVFYGKNIRPLAGEQLKKFREARQKKADEVSQGHYIIGDFKPYYDPTFGKWVQSKAERRELMRSYSGGPLTDAGDVNPIDGRRGPTWDPKRSSKISLEKALSREEKHLTVEVMRHFLNKQGG